jgi:hypothetical protein
LFDGGWGGAVAEADDVRPFRAKQVCAVFAGLDGPTT